MNKLFHLELRRSNASSLYAFEYYAAQNV